MNLVENVVLKPGILSKTLSWPHRVLAINEKDNRIVLISLPGKPNKKGKRKTHCSGPVNFKYEKIKEELDQGNLVISEFQVPSHWYMKDDDYLNIAMSDIEKIQLEKHLVSRDKAWSFVSKIIGNHTIREISLNTAIYSNKIARLANEAQINESTAYRWIHKYLSSGGLKSSLIPDFSRCGGPGRERDQRNKLGRPSRLYKLKGIESEGYILSENDKHRLSLGYKLISKYKTARTAYLETSMVFWSKQVTNVDGEIKTILFPKDQRPTLEQFRYWGEKLNNNNAGMHRVAVDNSKKSKKITAGSSQNQVVDVGQMAMIDSTSTDVYLTSALSRSIKIPPMNRSVVLDIKSTAIFGFYVGWESPSTATALQSIYISATNKVEICAKFGITISDDEWPGMIHKHYLADNGEAKSQKAKEAEEQFRFGLEYTKSYCGQLKSDVENCHHTFHKYLDHMLPGSTLGKRRERGESHPAENALWNYYEYVREFILEVIKYNNVLVPHIAPFEMLQEGVEPTRINTAKWMMKRGMRADIENYDIEMLRSFTLPSREAVITSTGIFLLIADKRRLPGHRFYSSELTNTKLFKKAHKEDCSIQITVKFDECDLRYIWVASEIGLLRIPNVEAKEELLNKMTLIDIFENLQSSDLKNDLNKQDVDNKQLEVILRRESITANAKKELRQEELVVGKKQTKRRIKSNLNQNRADEKKLIKSQMNPNENEVNITNKINSANTISSSANAMNEFMKKHNKD